MGTTILKAPSLRMWAFGSSLKSTLVDEHLKNRAEEWTRFRV